MLARCLTLVKVSPAMQAQGIGGGPARNTFRSTNEARELAGGQEDEGADVGGVRVGLGGATAIAAQGSVIAALKSSLSVLAGTL